MSQIIKREGESQLAFAKRVTLNKKEYDLDYVEWCELVCGKIYSSENARKAYYILKPFLEMVDTEEIERVSSNKVNEIIDIIGELDIKKQDVKQKISKLNKIKKELGNAVIIANDIKEFLIEDLADLDVWIEPRIESNGEYKLIVGVQDWHVGYVINNYKGNSYNYEIAKKRLHKLVGEIKKICERYNITDVVIMHLGDIIENTYMRDTQQAFECEFHMSEQISKATKLMTEFILSVAKTANVNIEVGMVGGNHSRMSTKATNIEGDNANVVIRENLITIFELIQKDMEQRITFLDVDYIDDTCLFEVNGLKVKGIHGDNRVGDKKKLFDSETTIDDENLDLIMLGHYHNFQALSQNGGGYVVTGGSLFGYNPYSVKRMGCNTNASQTLIVVGNGEIETIKDVNLQFN